MLGKKRKQKKQEESKSKVETILGAGTRIEGDIETRGSLRVEGHVEGAIKAEGDLFIGESGILKTTIEARNVVIAGKVEGDIKASQKIELLPGGVLNGDIQAEVLKIEEGGRFKGTSTPLENTSLQKKTERESKTVKKESASTK